MTEFLHGVEIKELNGGPRAIGIPSTSVIGLVGTALKGDTNKPILVSSLKEAKDIFAEAGDIDTGTTILMSLEAIFKQTRVKVIVINIYNQTYIDAIENSDLPSKTTAENDGIELLSSAASYGYPVPKLLIAPGLPTTTAKLAAVAKKLRAVAIVDCDGSDFSDSEGKAGDISPDSRLYLVDPKVKVPGSPDARPASPFVAGVIARSDQENGFWCSPSNQLINGISGTSYPVNFNLGSTSAVANVLNKANIATIIQKNGFRLWGNRTHFDNAKWKFINVRRTADIINDALMRAHLWALDQNITKTYIDDVTGSVNNFLRSLKSKGAIIDGKCWADAGVNTPDKIQNGEVTFSFDFTAPYPAEHITFRSNMVGDYLEELFK